MIKNSKYLQALVAVSMMIGAGTAVAQDGDWRFAIGTGFQALSFDGDVGFDTFRGPEEVDVDLSASDVNDVVESAFGFNASAAKDRWLFRVKYSFLELEDRSRLQPLTSIPGVIPASLTAKVDLEWTQAEASVVYQFAKTGEFRWGLLGGVRYVKHEYDVRITDGTTRVKSKPDADWTDGIVGLTLSVPFGDNWVWSNQAVVGFGDTDSYWQFVTAIDWNFAQSWQVGAFFEYHDTDYEDHSPGNVNWYSVDGDSTGPGITIHYMF